MSHSIARGRSTTAAHHCVTQPPPSSDRGNAARACVQSILLIRDDVVGDPASSGRGVGSAGSCHLDASLWPPAMAGHASPLAQVSLW